MSLITFFELKFLFFVVEEIKAFSWALKLLWPWRVHNAEVGPGSQWVEQDVSVPIADAAIELVGDGGEQMLPDIGFVTIRWGHILCAYVYDTECVWSLLEPAME